MSRNLKIEIFSSVIIAVVFVLGLSVDANANMQTVKASFNSRAEAQQSRYTEYKGVTLGMSADEARAKLGAPAVKEGDQDFYVFSQNETAQIVYDATHKVAAISVDYLGGIGAPDYKAVVGGELATTSNGSLYRMVRYESLGFWVSYNRTTSPVVTVTVTMQKI